MHMYMCMYPKLLININLINHIMIVSCQHNIIIMLPIVLIIQPEGIAYMLLFMCIYTCTLI